MIFSFVKHTIYFSRDEFKAKTLLSRIVVYSYNYENEYFTLKIVFNDYAQILTQNSRKDIPLLPLLGKVERTDP